MVFYVRSAGFLLFFFVVFFVVLFKLVVIHVVEVFVVKFFTHHAVHVAVLDFFLGRIAQADDGNIKLEIFPGQRVVKIQLYLVIATLAMRASSTWPSMLRT